MLRQMEKLVPRIQKVPETTNPMNKPAIDSASNVPQRLKQLETAVKQLRDQLAKLNLELQAINRAIKSK